MYTTRPGRCIWVGVPAAAAATHTSTRGGTPMSIRRSISGPGRALRWKVSAVLLTLATSVAGVLLATGPAQADAPRSELLISNLSWLNLGVRGGSYNAGTDVIQWTATGTDEQRWVPFYYPG